MLPNKRFVKSTCDCFDINQQRLDELRQKVDRTNEISPQEFSEAELIEFTNDEDKLINKMYLLLQFRHLLIMLSGQI